MGRPVLVGLVLIAGLGLLGWLVLRPVHKPSATLPNGLRITLEGVTFGTNHLFTTDSKLTRTLRHILPAPLQSVLPKAYEREEHTDVDEALVYLSAFDASSGGYLSSRIWGRFLVLDEHGCFWPVNSLSGDY